LSTIFSSMTFMRIKGLERRREVEAALYEMRWY
jgi:hypothetical protein